MRWLVNGAKYLIGIFWGALSKEDLPRVWERVQAAIAKAETFVRESEGLTGAEKKAKAKKEILKRLQLPFYKKWIVSFVLGYVIDAAVAWRNKVYGKFWGSDVPQAGFAEAVETEVESEPISPPAARSMAAQPTPAKVSLAVDGVTAETLREAIRKHNEADVDRRVHELGTLVQTALETGHFKSFRYFNLAGIKSTPGWEKVGGKIWNAATKEAVKGTLVSTTGRFRAYDSLSHFLDDYSGLIHRCYPVTVRNLDCIWLYLAGFYKGKYGAWATDGKYYGKLCALVVRYAPEVLGDGWQTRLADSFQLARQRGFPEVWMETAALKAMGG